MHLTKSSATFSLQQKSKNLAKTANFGNLQIMLQRKFASPVLCFFSFLFWNWVSQKVSTFLTLFLCFFLFGWIQERGSFSFLALFFFFLPCFSFSCSFFLLLFNNHESRFQLGVYRNDEMCIWLLPESRFVDQPLAHLRSKAESLQTDSDDHWVFLAFSGILCC